MLLIFTLNAMPLLFTVIVGCSLFLSTLELVLIPMRGIPPFSNNLILHSHC
ncbi:unnamed protein product, partial [Arabidopsis halleri]